MQLVQTTPPTAWLCPYCSASLSWQEAMEQMNASELPGSKDITPSPTTSHIEIRNLLDEAVNRMQQGQIRTATFLFEDASKIMEQLPEILAPASDFPGPSKLASLYFLIGDCQGQLGDCQKALRWYIKGQDYLAKHSLPRDPMAYCSMGDACRNLSQLDNAIALYMQGIEIASASQKTISYADVFYNLSICHEENEDLDSAIDCLEKCLHHRPNDPDALFNLGMLSARTGDYRRAVKALQAFLEIGSSGDAGNQARSALSQIYQKM
jgi:tetratricopeptide (TPR) repeat protein